jgi:predicted dehydrogenase
MRKVTGAVLGAGCRPFHSLMGAVKKGRLNLKYIYDQDLHRAEFLSREMDGDPGRAVSDLNRILEDDSLDCIFIMTPEKYHRDHVERVASTSSSVFLEKPLATNPEDTLAIYHLLQSIHNGRKKQIGFVLRYAPFYAKIRELVDSGILGEITLIRASESLGFGHGVSFFRRWHRLMDNTGGLINEKCCHDLDLLNWYAGARPVQVSSFRHASLCPPDPTAPQRCSDCNRLACPYRFDIDNAVGVHLTDQMRARPADFGLDLCVYNSGHDIPDRQSVMIQYDNGILGTFSVNLISGREEREIVLYGDRAMIKGNFRDGIIEIWENQRVEKKQVIPLDGDPDASGHGGGDDIIINDFIESVAEPSHEPLARIEDGIISSMMAFAAERSAQENRVVLLSEMLSEELLTNISRGRSPASSGIA